MTDLDLSSPLRELKNKLGTPECSSIHARTQYAGVIWTKGNATVTGGEFFQNTANDRGGVFDAAGEGFVTVEGGNFYANHGGSEGGVGFGTTESMVVISGGEFFGNFAESTGGAFSVEREADFMVREVVVGGTGVPIIRSGIQRGGAAESGLKHGNKWQRLTADITDSRGMVLFAVLKKNVLHIYFLGSPPRPTVGRLPVAHCSCSS